MYNYDNKKRYLRRFLCIQWTYLVGVTGSQVRARWWIFPGLQYWNRLWRWNFNWLTDESYNEIEFNTPDEEFLDYSNEMFLYKEYSYDFADEHDYEYDEVSISNDQIMLENISEI